MKKSILALIILLIICMNKTSAQTVGGLRIEYSNYTVTASGFGLTDVLNASGWNLGFISYSKLKNNFYTNYGWTIGMTGSFNTYGIPVYVGLNIPVSNSNLSLFGQAGAYLEYWYLSSSNKDLKKWINPWQPGLALMGGISIKKFKIELGYKYGLMNLASINEGEYNGIYYGNSSLKLSSVVYGVSYVF